MQLILNKTVIGIMKDIANKMVNVVLILPKNYMEIMRSYNVVSTTDKPKRVKTKLHNGEGS